MTMSSCNVRLYYMGSTMRNHNLSQNKYQPGKYRKKVNMGKHQNSPFFYILRNN